MVLSNIKYLIYFIISHKFCEGASPHYRWSVIGLIPMPTAKIMLLIRE